MYPLINAEVELRAPDGSIIAATIAFVTETYAAIERPVDHPEHDVPDGAPYELMWPTTNGVNIQPVSVTERPGRANTTIWQAAEAGDHRLEQRRAFVRVSLTAPMTITDLSIDEEGDPLAVAEPQDSLLLDVSEAALRCTVYGERWAQLEIGSPVSVDFVLDDTEFGTRGRLLRVRRHAGEPAIEVIVMFDAALAFTATLRRAVFAEQRRMVATDRATEDRTVEELWGAVDLQEPEVPSPRQRKWWQLR